jgi:hypothetical protein
MDVGRLLASSTLPRVLGKGGVLGPEERLLRSNWKPC